MFVIRNSGSIAIGICFGKIIIAIFRYTVEVLKPELQQSSDLILFLKNRKRSIKIKK